MTDELAADATGGECPDSASSAITLVVVDGHDVVHAGIGAWCVDADPPIKLVGNFHNSTEMLAHYPDIPNEVDVVVFDVLINGDRPAFDALRAMCRAGQRVIVYSPEGDPDGGPVAMRLGVGGSRSTVGRTRSG